MKTQILLTASAALLLMACTSETVSTEIVSNDHDAHEASHGAVHSDAEIAAKLHLVKSMFVDDAIVSGPDVVDCTLSGGTQTQCIKLTFDASNPVGLTPGPWCPRTLDSTAETSGIWIKDDVIYDLSGEFVKNLSTFYDDDYWQVYNPETGEVNYTKTEESCKAAARPDVDPAYYNYCIECSTDYVKGFISSFMIPLNPVKSDTVQDVTRYGVGVSFNGNLYDEPAPIKYIIAAHTFAPFDDCGGHINPHVGYHIHAPQGCTREHEVEQKHASVIGLALDGNYLTSRYNPDGSLPADLDQCSGHVTDGLGYHYHHNEPAENQTLSCFTHETGCSHDNDYKDYECDATTTRGGPPPEVFEGLLDDGMAPRPEH